MTRPKMRVSSDKLRYRVRRERWWSTARISDRFREKSIRFKIASRFGSAAVSPPRAVCSSTHCALLNQALAASSPILVGKRRVSEAKQCETRAEFRNLRRGAIHDPLCRPNCWPTPTTVTHPRPPKKNTRSSERLESTKTHETRPRYSTVGVNGR